VCIHHRLCGVVVGSIDGGVGNEGQIHAMTRASRPSCKVLATKRFGRRLNTFPLILCHPVDVVAVESSHSFTCERGRSLVCEAVDDNIQIRESDADFQEVRSDNLLG